MREILLVNDIHLGAIRSAGTTPSSAFALRKYLQDSLRGLMMEHTDKDIVINGDLFDTFNVPMSDVLEFYTTATAWLGASEGKLVMGRGNHDWSKDSAKMSSFDFIGQILARQFPGRVIVVTEPQMIFDGIYMIPHMPNQARFDLELERAETLRDCAVLVHANYDNYFATQSDGSLNVTAEWCNMMSSYGNEIVFGHEHVGRTLPGVWIAGNQTPSSVSDCLGNSHKFAHILSQDE